ncbi:MAG TPA: CmpA/NrtA family ABC transporter substrate-binding protein [Methylophilaceae bacterium]|nr:CmpA/NrtA family ABC transporter substrate-binding protein [Methylophilaceae bacterium]
MTHDQYKEYWLTGHRRPYLQPSNGVSKGAFLFLVLKGSKMAANHTSNNNNIAPSSSGRREFIKATAVSAAALVSGVTSSATSAGNNKSGSCLEKSHLTFGIIPLTDCAPIVIAKEKGFFKKYGLDVKVSKEASWANIRDKVSSGLLDGAHMLAGMPISATLGVGSIQKDTVTAFSMDLNGNGITVSNSLYDRMMAADPEAMRTRPTTAVALKKVIDADKKAGKEPMVFAMVYPVSSHNYEIRYWMASAGIDPDKDVRLIVIPPSKMVSNLDSNSIDGYCVGEPWNQQAVALGIGKSIITSYEIWNNSPEKVFGVTREWANNNPCTHKATIKAMIEASQWMDIPDNRKEVVRIIASKEYIDAPQSVVENSMTGTWTYSNDESPVTMPDFNVFHRYTANFPWQSHAIWTLTQMVRWGQIDQVVDFKKVAESVYLSDVYREAAEELGIAAPITNFKSEGSHAAPWLLKEATNPIAMGADQFFDGNKFDPHDPVHYLKSFSTHNMKLALADLVKANA